MKIFIYNKISNVKIKMIHNIIKIKSIRLKDKVLTLHNNNFKILIPVKKTKFNFKINASNSNILIKIVKICIFLHRIISYNKLRLNKMNL